MNKDLLIDDILKEKAGSEALSLPEDLDLKIKETLADLPERKIHKSKLAKRAVTAAVITVAAAIGLSFAFPVYARNAPVIGSVFQFLSGKNLIDRDYIEYSSDLNLSKTSNDVKVTINSIAYDGINLDIAYTVESAEKMSFDPNIIDSEFKINGETTIFSSIVSGKLINKNTFVGVNSFQVSRDYLPREITKNILGGDIKIPDNFIMDLKIKMLSGSIKGNWDFKFKVSLDKIEGKVKKVNTSIDLYKIGSYLKVNEVVFTPINTVLRTITADIVEYSAFDDKGRILLCKGESGKVSKDTKGVYMQYTFRNIYEDTNSVTFIPIIYSKEYRYNLTNAKGSYEPMKETVLNLNGITTLSEGKFGEYKINKIESLGDKTLVYYECTNVLPDMGPYGLIIKDESGKLYALKNNAVKDLGDNKFVAEIESLTKDKKYTLMARDLEKIYDIRDDLKFTIDVNK